MITGLLLAVTLVGNPTGPPKRRAPVDTVQTIDYLKRVDDVIQRAYERGDFDESDVAIEKRHLKYKSFKNGSHLGPTYFITELDRDFWTT